MALLVVAISNKSKKNYCPAVGFVTYNTCIQSSSLMQSGSNGTFKNCTVESSYSGSLHKFLNVPAIRFVGMALRRWLHTNHERLDLQPLCR